MLSLARDLRCPPLLMAVVLAELVTLGDGGTAYAAIPAYPPLRLGGQGGSGGPTPSPKMAVPDVESSKLVPDDRWCGIEAAPSKPEAPLPCSYVGLPCGPTSADQISHGGGETGEDLDGDGQPELTLAGHREVPRPEGYAAIYRSTAAGYVLADYQVMPPRAEPTVAGVLFAAPGQPPLLRDGYDIILPGGKTTSIARLRRWDGQRFRVLLSFCAHRAEPAPGLPGAMRQGNNRVEIVDIDKDGKKDIVVQGLIRPVVFRWSDSGLALSEDPALGQLYRDNSPETQRVKSLRDESRRLLEGGQVRRAAESLLRAQAVTPYDVALTLELCELLLRAGQADRAVELLSRARYQAPQRAGIYCALSRAYRSLGDTDAERGTLHSCLGKEPDEALRSEAESRLRELAK